MADYKILSFSKAYCMKYYDNDKQKVVADLDGVILQPGSVADIKQYIKDNYKTVVFYDLIKNKFI